MKARILSLLIIVAFFFSTLVSQARWYNPATGRFMTMDSFEGNNDDPLSLHKYLYCKNNPVNLVDPTGMLAEDPEFAGALNAQMTSWSGAATATARVGLMKGIADTTAIISVVALSTMNLGEVQPQWVDPTTGQETWNPNLLYRMMRQAGNAPSVGTRFAELGVRPEKDFITPLGALGMVNPGNGGLSVAIGTPFNLDHRVLPMALGGEGRYPLWGIHSSFLLPNGLISNPHGSKTHSYIEPMRPMPLATYQNALAATRDEWLQLTR